jgi:hypothetical protein
MRIRSYVTALTIAFGLSVASGASALEVANGLSVNGLSVNGLSVNGLSVNGLSVNGLSVNGLSVNGLSVNGLSVNGTEKSAALSLKAIVLQDDQVLVIK